MHQAQVVIIISNGYRTNLSAAAEDARKRGVYGLQLTRGVLARGGSRKSYALIMLRGLTAQRRRLLGRDERTVPSLHL
jgi:hypothetical protein